MKHSERWLKRGAAIEESGHPRRARDPVGRIVEGFGPWSTHQGCAAESENECQHRQQSGKTQRQSDHAGVLPIISSNSSSLRSMTSACASSAWSYPSR